MSFYIADVGAVLSKPSNKKFYIAQSADWSDFELVEYKLISVLLGFTYVSNFPSLYTDYGFPKVVLKKRYLYYGDVLICDVGSCNHFVSANARFRFRDWFLVHIDLHESKRLWIVIDCNTGRLVDALSHNINITSGRVFAQILLALPYFDFFGTA